MITNYIHEFKGKEISILAMGEYPPMGAKKDERRNHKILRNLLGEQIDARSEEWISRDTVENSRLVLFPFSTRGRFRRRKRRLEESRSSQ